MPIKRIALKLTDEELAQLEQISDRDSRSLTGEVHYALRMFLGYRFRHQRANKGQDGPSMANDGSEKDSDSQTWPDTGHRETAPTNGGP